MVNERQSLQLLDIYLSAFIQYSGIEPLLSKQSGRVVFIYPNSPRVMELIEQYNGNPSVRLLDYAQHIRRLRSRMISMRD